MTRNCKNELRIIRLENSRFVLSSQLKTAKDSLATKRIENQIDRLTYKIAMLKNDCRYN